MKIQEKNMCCMFLGGGTDSATANEEARERLEDLTQHMFFSSLDSKKGINDIQANIKRTTSSLLLSNSNNSEQEEELHSKPKFLESNNSSYTPVEEREWVAMVEKLDLIDVAGPDETRRDRAEHVACESRKAAVHINRVFDDGPDVALGGYTLDEPKGVYAGRDPEGYKRLYEKYFLTL